MKGLTALAMLAALTLSACTTPPEPPEPPVCRWIKPPQQWLDYCTRNPSDPDC